MGTNYYLRKKIISESEIKELHNKLDQVLSYKEDETEFIGMLKSTMEEIHICKFSCGWQTCFDHNWGKYYKPNRKSLEEFLSNSEYQIVDEYGDKYTPEEFWKMVDERNSNPVNRFTSETYDEFESSRNPNYRPYISYGDITRCTEMFGIDTSTNDFQVDGLRFAVYSDFS